MGKSKHPNDCKLRNCDGTEMGHRLAQDFPKETQKLKDGMDRLRRPDDHYRIDIEYCEARARKGTGEGVCDAALDVHGNCPYAENHL